MPADTTSRLVKYALPYLTGEYIAMFAFSSQATAGGNTYTQIITWLIGIFTGVGGFFASQMPAEVAGLLMTVHFIMLAIFMLWFAQSIAGVSPV